jgi:zinc protease
MSTRLLLAAALCGGAFRAGAQPASPPTPPPASPAPPRVVTLENGFQVIVAENHSVPLSTAKVVVRTGAMTQELEEQGVPHLFEHMLFKGYRGIGGRPFVSETAELQAGYNGTTSEELVTYYLTLPSAGTARGIDLLAGLVREPRFEADDLRTERFVVLGEMQRDDSDPQDVLRRGIARALWGEAWPRKNTIGDQMSLLSATPKRLSDIYQQWYVPNNAALVVTGDVSADAVIDAARKQFGSWKARPDPFAAHPVPEPPPLAKSQALVLEGDVTAVTVQLQWQGPSVRDDAAGTYDADVLSDVLNDPESPFMQRLVDSGFFQSAHVGYQTLVHRGPISFVGTTTVEQLAAALTTLSGELAIMRGEEYFEPRALAAAAKRRRVAQSFEREEGVTLAHSLAYAWAVTGLPYQATYVDSLAARRPRDLTGFVSKYIVGRPFVVGVLTPPNTRPQVSAMIAQFMEFVTGTEEKQP